VAAAEASPIGDDELGSLFDEPFAECKHVVLAVSGGADSTAMMHLAAAWAARRGAGAPALSVVTVDHCLRPESGAEAERVAEDARCLGLPHTTLVWSEPKPATGLQAAARNARHRLIGDHMQRNNLRWLALAHTADDQAETLLMRLARGSGVDGLAAMRPSTTTEWGILRRPLLRVSKARLVATLVARGIDWIEDPSNERPEFERVRLRRAAATLAGLGLGPHPLGLAARRLARASAALDFLAGYAASLGAGKVRADRLGFAVIDWPWLTSWPEEVRLRLLLRLIRWVGGGRDRPLALGRLEAMTEGRGWRPPIGRTLAGALFLAGNGAQVLLVREAGRRGLPSLGLQPGRSTEWDNRFTVWLAKHAPEPLTVAALGRTGRVWLRDQGVEMPPAPLRVLEALPGLWRGDRLAAAPQLGFHAKGLDPSSVSCRLTAEPFTPRAVSILHSGER
jgi:tRNA(Ile)-lysidine synthase